MFSMNIDISIYIKVIHIIYVYVNNCKFLIKKTPNRYFRKKQCTTHEINIKNVEKINVEKIIIYIKLVDKIVYCSVQY